MEYLLLIYRNEAEFAAWPKAKWDEMIAGMAAFSKDIQASGHYRGGDPLKPAQTATTVRLRGGKALKTAGPFAETREQLTGYYKIAAASLDEATEIAARMPVAPYAAIEVREVLVLK